MVELKKKAALATASLILTLAAAEIAFRAVNVFRPPGEGPKHELTPYGWRIVPRDVSLFRDLHGEFSFLIAANSWGMHDDEIDVEKPRGVRRFAFFGDSYTEALHVAKADNFVERIESRVDGIQTLNFGAGGFGPDLCYLRYLHEGRLFNPDVVFLIDLVENDAHDVTAEAYPRWQKPHYDLDADTWIAREPMPAGITFGTDPRAARWYRKSHLYTLKREATVRWRAWMHERMGKVGTTPLPFYWQMMVVPPDAYWQKAWKTFERVIERFRDDVEKDGREFVFVIMPSRFEIHPEYWDLITKKHKIDGTIDLSFPRRTVADIAARLHLKTIDLYPVMKEKGALDRLYLKRDGHLTAAGHRVVAEEIGRQMGSLVPVK